MSGFEARQWFSSTFLSSQAPKYHGLFNQGATCCLNSVLQVLFMTKDFREAVERYTDENPDTIDRHLNSLFSDLQKYPAYTYDITRALSIDRVYEQRDAAEYIERILRLTSKGASQIFHGLLSHRTKCCKCGTETDRDEAFWHLPLALVDSCSEGYSVVDGIKDFFRASDFSGEDQIHCDSCDDKVDATAQCVIKHHPDVLILLLKRFEFSDRHRSYVKISHVVDVPATIEIPERQMYKLYAVVDHSGVLRGGHYTATIKDEGEDRWYHFNDSRVSLCDFQPFQVDNLKRSQTAQLLFYRKMEAASSAESGLRMSGFEARQWFSSTFLSSQAPKYHGLFNQGATCYLNSVLQVLFMTKDFREAVERYTDENPDTIDRHLNSLFSDLQKYPAYTYDITRALSIDRVYEQRDAAEYIERILRLTSKGASQIFHGLLSHRTKCCKCGTETDRDEAFWHLPLALVDSCSDSYSVVDGIKDFFRAADFSGEDQIHCDSCDDKVDATAQCVIKHHPDVLILLLKRFEFSDRHRSYVKISHVVDVPATIEIPERQMYKLYAVVDHSGVLRGGHYTATIKDEGEDRWYHFNDSRVSLCDFQPFQVDNLKRSQTAQLLFYRKEEAVIQDNMSTDHNQCEDAEKTRQRDEGEDDVETGDKQSEKPRDAEHLSEGRLDKQNRNEDLACNLKTGQQFDSECKQGRRTRLDKKPEQQRKERRREVVGNN